MLKSRLEVKLNDLEKKHLETKEREAQTVGFLERKLKQVELEHKTELKLRRQLRFEVNNLRKRLLETYQLYTDTLEQNESLRNDLDRLRKGISLVGRSETKLSISREVEVQIEKPDPLTGDRVGIDPGSMINLRGIEEIESKENKLSMSFDVRRNEDSAMRGFLSSDRLSVGNYCSTADRSRGKEVRGGQTFGGGKTRNPCLKSERAKDWLNQIEELYKPLEYPKLGIGKHKKRSDPLITVGVDDSFVQGEYTSSDEDFYSDDYSFTESTQDVITNTGFILDQISQQDKELSSLLNTTFLTVSRGKNLSKERQKVERGNRKQSVFTR
ncbi:hypothetical protein HWI79_2431 [Cryptosporidium felis]|nr:hypothetical protein HWI79_2431 [Cryptosporidium felis]